MGCHFWARTFFRPPFYLDPPFVDIQVWYCQTPPPFIKTPPPPPIIWNWRVPAEQSFWVCVTRHAQSIQNKKFAHLCNTLRKAWRMKLICCPKINTKVISWYYRLGCVQPGMPKIPKVRSLHIFAISPEKHGGWS